MGGLTKSDAEREKWRQQNNTQNKNDARYQARNDVNTLRDVLTEGQRDLERQRQAAGRGGGAAGSGTSAGRGGGSRA
ncbi:hypothetical protein CSOJ01_09558 [Colletotrichum sojae]|uniref:Uncharacterized protein n=1 Tax=Colletotrichum sojae TaxID=2175907 RepID=A0A8H6J2V5_9PEZI|nr:hypothetical protein CSOJ01_09558 [Colletotrichum sojae]